jgi:hypothetical protein
MVKIRYFWGTYQIPKKYFLLKLDFVLDSIKCYTNIFNPLQNALIYSLPSGSQSEYASSIITEYIDFIAHKLMII